MNEATVEIRAACLRLLAMREHSKTELLQKLTHKGFDRTLSARAIDVLAKDGCQSDLRYAESYTRSRILKGYGPLRIAFELRQHGIENFDPNNIAVREAGGWAELLKRLYWKKYRPASKLPVGEWAKRSRFLTQRGFDGELIRELFENLNIKLNHR